MHLIHYFLIIPLAFCSCKSSKPTKAIPSSEIVTADEILTTLGGITFFVKVDLDVKEGQFCGLARKFADGTIKPIGGSSGFKTGDLVKYVCIQPEDGLFRYSFTSDSHGSSGSSKNFPKFISSIQSSSGPNPFKVGDTISRYSVDDQFSKGKELEGDDFDLIFYIQPLEN